MYENVLHLQTLHQVFKAPEHGVGIAMEKKSEVPQK